MSTAELIDQIKALPPEEIAVIKAYLGSADVLQRQPDGVETPDPLLDRITARREAIRQRSGALPDSTSAIREWRDGIE